MPDVPPVPVVTGALTRLRAGHQDRWSDGSSSSGKGMLRLPSSGVIRWPSPGAATIHKTGVVIVQSRLALARPDLAALAVLKRRADAADVHPAVLSEAIETLACLIKEHARKSPTETKQAVAVLKTVPGVDGIYVDSSRRDGLVVYAIVEEHSLEMAALLLEKEEELSETRGSDIEVRAWAHQGRPLKAAVPPGLIKLWARDGRCE